MGLWMKVGGECNMKKPVVTRFLLVAMVLSLLFGLVACQQPTSGETPTTAPSDSQGTTTTDNTPAPQEIVTLSAFTGSGSGDITVAPWYSAYLRENLGIEFEFIISAGDVIQMTQALMSGGELPDIMNFNARTALAKQAVEAGLMLPLDDYQDQLPSVFGSNDQFKYSNAYMRDFFSDSSGKLFLLPQMVGKMESINCDPQLRWDIYQQIGAPEINTMEDYLPVLKQMVDAYPQTESGQKTYGISLFPSWDGFNLSNATYIMHIYGVDGSYASQLVETYADGTQDPLSMLDDGSQYKRNLKFYFQANQMGLLDPDSVTQTWDAISAKWAEGRIMFSPWSWSVSGFNNDENVNAETPKGYASVWPKDTTMLLYPDQYTGATESIMGIGKASTKVDAALKFIDFYYSIEGNDLIYNGPQGIIWDVGEDGKRYVTEEGWNIIDNGSDLPGGGALSAARGIFNSSPFSGNSAHPDYPGQPLDYTLWESTLLRSSSQLTEEWRDANGGAINSMKKAINDGNVVKSTAAVTMVQPMSDDMAATYKQIGDAVKTHSWKAVYAKDEAEFEAIWDQMQADADGLGMQEYMTWFMGAWNEALANDAKYAP